jgi:hydrogenase/urease accessory protein HupE
LQHKAKIIPLTEEVVMNREGRLATPVVFVIASILGLLIAATDVAAPFGDDTAQFIVFLFLATGGVLGFARPRCPWWWGLSVGPWLPLMHLILRASGIYGPFRAKTFGSAFILLLVAVAVCSLGSYGGARVRRVLPFPRTLA